MRSAKKLTALLLCAAMTFTPVVTPVYAVDDIPGETSAAETPHPTGSEDITFYITKLPDKLVYRIGEPLDLTGGAAFAGGTYTNGEGAVMNWDDFEQPMTYKHYILDDSKFDNTKPGTYKIYLTCNGQLESKTVSFEVSVVDEPTTLPPTTDPSEASKYEDFFIRGPKKQFYKLGDDLDMSGAYASVNGEKIPASDPRFSVDASAYDNTKPGVYTIYLTFKDGGFTYTNDFFAMVLNADGTAPDGYPTPTGEDNPYAPSDTCPPTSPTTSPTSATVSATDGVTFERLGDIDANGETDVMDVIKINKCLLGASELVGLARLAADMNGDGKLDSSDAMAILKKSLGIAWQDAAEPVTEDPTDPITEPTTMYIDPTDHCKEWPSDEYEEMTAIPSGAGDTQPAQISEHFYGADIWMEPASDGVKPPRIIVETSPSGSSIGIYGYEFHKTNNLICIALTETSGSYKLTVDDVVVDADGNYVVKITRTMPQIATCDLATWHFNVKTDKGCTSSNQVKLEITDLHI